MSSWSLYCIEFTRDDCFFSILFSWGEQTLKGYLSVFLGKSINVVSLFVFFKERKAAKLSKEALKKLHSETQRLIRGKETYMVNIEV